MTTKRKGPEDAVDALLDLAKDRDQPGEVRLQACTEALDRAGVVAPQACDCVISQEVTEDLLPALRALERLDTAASDLMNAPGVDPARIAMLADVARELFEDEHRRVIGGSPEEN